MAYLTNRSALGFCLFGLLLVGCKRQDQNADTTSARDSTQSIERPTSSAQTWFADERVLDLTGDGTADTARVEAIGPTADSLEIVFTIRSSGSTVYRNSWSRAYALSAISVEVSTIPHPDSALRRQLASFLSELKIRPLDRKELQRSWLNRTDDCSDDPRNCIALQLLDDSTKKAGFSAGRSLVPLFDTSAVYGIIADMLAHPVLAISYTYGSESQARIAWSPARHQFFTLYECC